MVCKLGVVEKITNKVGRRVKVTDENGSVLLIRKTRLLCNFKNIRRMKAISSEKTVVLIQQHYVANISIGH